MLQGGALTPWRCNALRPDECDSFFFVDFIEKCLERKTTTTTKRVGGFLIWSAIYLEYFSVNVKSIEPNKHTSFRWYIFNFPSLLPTAQLAYDVTLDNFSRIKKDLLPPPLFFYKNSNKGH